jgi:hypothetical protein
MIPTNIRPEELHLYLHQHPEASGWAWTRENQVNIDRLGDAATTWCNALPMGSSTGHPAEFLPTWIKIEDQGPISSCGGNSLTSCGEVCERNEHRGSQYRQFSRMAAYQISKRRDGIRGDGGMTIDSGVWYATQHGFALESDYPYPARYPGDNIPPQAFGKEFTVENARRIRDVASFMQWLTTNQGPIFIGMRWTKWCDNERDFIRTFLGPQRNDQHGGGHAVMFYGWTTNNVGVCPIVWNSWSTRWGNQGRKAVFPLALQEMLADRITTAVGFTWRRKPEPENWSFWQNFQDWMKR